MPRLIVTNGDSAIERLRAVGIAGEILSWADMLHDGPVRAGLSLEDLSAERARFLADELGLPHDKVSADFGRRDALIRAHEGFDHVELWFEHDLYDQLQLIQLLDFFASEGRHEGVALMQTSDYLGLQSEASLGALDGTARPITARQLSLAQRAWAAFRAPAPAPLAQLATEATISPISSLLYTGCWRRCRRRRAACL